MGSSNSVPVIPDLITEVDSLKQQVHSAVDVFCINTLQTSSEDGLKTAIATLNAVLDQLKDKGNQASSGKGVAAVDDEIQKVLLSRMDRLEQLVLECVGKEEQMEERQKVLEDVTSATKTELCYLRDQLTSASRTRPPETSLKELQSAVQSRFAQVDQELGKSKKRLQGLERSQLDTSESVGQEMNMVKLTIMELKKKIVNLTEAVSSAEDDICVLTGNASEVQEKMSYSEKKVSHVEQKISGIEARLKKTKLKEKNQMSSKNDQLILSIEKKVDNLEKLKTILNQLKDRTMERGALSSKVDQMEQNLSQLSQTVGKLHQTMSPPPIAFCARLAEDKSVKIREGQKLDKFTKIICNAGNALDATRGIFTIPRDGLYCVTAQIIGVGDTSEYSQVVMMRRRSNTGVEEEMAWLPIKPNDAESSCTNIMRLKTGDQVFLDVTDADEGAQLSWASVFAGWLIR